MNQCRQSMGKLASSPTCYIIGAGPCDVQELKRGLKLNMSKDADPKDYVIAADGGLKYLDAAGICPDLVVGDFDTLGKVPEHDNVVRLKVVKDVTDTFVAMEKGVELGYRNFVFYGCLGGKLEHTLANLQHLVWLATREMTGWLVEGCQVVTALKGPGTLHFSEVPDGAGKVEAARQAAAEKGLDGEAVQGVLGMVSIFAHTEKAEGVNLTGMKYPLTNAVLTNEFPLGISNEFAGPASAISVEKGTLLVVLPKSAMERML